MKMYDNIEINGTSKISSFKISSNVISYSKNKDFHSFYIIARVLNSENNKLEWKTQYKGLSAELYPNIYNNYQTLLRDDKFEHTLIQIYSYLTDVGDLIKNVDIYKMNSTIYLPQENASDIIANYNVTLVGRFENFVEKGQIKTKGINVKSELKKKFRNLYTNFNYFNDKIPQNIEYFENYFMITNSNSNRYRVFDYAKERNLKVKMIYSNNHLNQSIIQFKTTNDLIYVKRNILKSQINEFIYDYPLIILEETFPKELKDYQILDIMVKEKILVLLFENGALLSLDISTLESKFSLFRLISYHIQDINFRKWSVINIIFNSLNFLQLTILSIIRLFFQRRRRNELNNIINDIIVFNNEQENQIRQHISRNFDFNNERLRHYFFALLGFNSLISRKCRDLINLLNSIERNRRNEKLILLIMLHILELKLFQHRYFFDFINNHEINNSQENQSRRIDPESTNSNSESNIQDINSENRQSVEPNSEQADNENGNKEMDQKNFDQNSQEANGLNENRTEIISDKNSV